MYAKIARRMHSSGDFYRVRSIVLRNGRGNGNFA